MENNIVTLSIESWQKIRV